MINGRSRGITLADADRSIYKLSDGQAATIRRPHWANDAWQVIKKGSWKLVSFFIWQTRGTRDKLQMEPSRAARNPLALDFCPTVAIYFHKVFQKDLSWPPKYVHVLYVYIRWCFCLWKVEWDCRFSRVNLSSFIHSLFACVYRDQIWATMQLLVLILSYCASLILSLKNQYLQRSNSAGMESAD